MIESLEYTKINSIVSQDLRIEDIENNGNIKNNDLFKIISVSFLSANFLSVFNRKF